MPARAKSLALRLQGKVILVSGGGHGLGRSTVVELARQGATVVFTYSRDRAEAALTLRQARAAGGPAVAVRADATDFAAAGRVVRGVIRRFRRLDALVNNVGGSGKKEGPIWTMSEEEWDRVITLNVKTAFNHTRAACPQFIAQKSGAIVNMGSINGLRGREGQPAYTTAKAALVGFTKTLAKELGFYNVSVNMVATGYIDTARSRATVKELHRRSILNDCAIRHLTQPEEVAVLIAFLCSDAARFLTGTVIKLDSGEYI